jgi:hypothetical protein
MKTINLSFTHLLLGLAILVGFPAVFNEGYCLGHYEMASLHQRAMVREANRELAGKNIQTESEAFTALGIQNGRWNSAYKWTKETGVDLAETPLTRFSQIANIRRRMLSCKLLPRFNNLLRRRGARVQQNEKPVH